MLFRSFPIGLDVEVCTFAALERAWREADQIFHREHVMPFIYENVRLEPLGERLSAGLSGRGFRMAVLNHVPDYGSQRWTVDTPEDLEFIRGVFTYLKDKNDFTWYDILAITRAHPELTGINARVRHKSMIETDTRSLDDDRPDS